MQRSVLAGALLAVLIAAQAATQSAQAQAQKLTPGLWEHQIAMKGPAGARMDIAMSQMKQKLDRMPPAQRQQMEAMLAQRGMTLSGSPGGPTMVRVCITPEQAARDELPVQGEGRCKQTSKERSGNTVRFKFACAGEHPTTGEGETTFVSDKEHRGRVTVDTTLKGQPQRLEMDTVGRWIAADCGDVKPRP